MADTYTTALYERDAVAFWISQYAKDEFATLNPTNQVAVRNDNVKWDGPTVRFPRYKGGVTISDLDLTGATTSESAAVESDSETATIVNKVASITISNVKLRDAYDNGTLFDEVLKEVAYKVVNEIDKALVTAAMSGALSYSAMTSDETPVADVIRYNHVVDARYKLGSKQHRPASLLLAPKSSTDLRKDSDIKNMSAFGYAVQAKGIVPELDGMPVVVSDNVTVNDLTVDTYNNLIVLKDSLYFGMRQEVTYEPLPLADFRTRHQFMFSFYVKKVKTEIEPVVKVICK